MSMTPDSGAQTGLTKSSSDLSWFREILRKIQRVLAKFPKDSMKILQIWEESGKNGELRQGVFLEISGETFQLVRYDQDNGSIVVQSGNRVEQMKSDEIPEFVRRRLDALR